jgi:hypothetical protein
MRPMEEEAEGGIAKMSAKMFWNLVGRGVNDLGQLKAENRAQPWPI